MDEFHNSNCVICKVDLPKKTVYGWAYVSTVKGKQVPDHSGDTWTIDEIEKTAHKFVCECRQGKIMHRGEKVAELVSSVVMSDELQKALGIDLGLEGWLVGYQIEDPEILKKIADGELTMFSIGGTGMRVKDDA